MVKVLTRAEAWKCISTFVFPEIYVAATEYQKIGRVRNRNFVFEHSDGIVG